MRVVPLVVASLLAIGAPAVAALGADARPSADPPWTAPLRAADEALQANNPRRAARELQTAYLAALASRKWEGMMAVGDAARRVGEAAGAPKDTLPRARRAYLTAVLRARAEASLEGVLRAAEAFAALGDRTVAEQSLRVAHELAQRHQDAAALARVHVLANRLAERPLAAGDLRVE